MCHIGAAVDITFLHFASVVDEDLTRGLAAKLGVELLLDLGPLQVIHEV